MNSEDYVNWLYGYTTLHGKPPTAQEWQIIREHFVTIEGFSWLQKTEKMPRLICPPIFKDEKSRH